MQRVKKSLLFCLIFILSLCGGDARSQQTHTAYVLMESIPPDLLPPPPPEKSAKWRAGIEDVVAVQKTMNPADETAIRAEQKPRLELVTNFLGADINPHRLPKTFALLQNAFADALLAADTAKQYWKTRRPYLKDKRIKLLVEPIDASPAYPSGHTCSSRVVAEILGILFPEKREALRARADEIAWHRVEAGVHYPFDLEAGRLLAMLTIGEMMADTKFKSDLEAARQEITASTAKP